MPTDQVETPLWGVWDGMATHPLMRQATNHEEEQI